MKNWFKDILWEDVVRINAAFCERGKAQHGFSESQGPPLKKLWEEKAETPMTFWAMLQLCTKMHEGAPFFNFNGNTFAALAVEASLQISHPDQFLLEDAIYNAICGALTETQERNLKAVSQHLEKEDPPIEM